MIALKVGVKLTDLCSQMVLATMVVAGVMEEMGVVSPSFPCVITSGNDSKHSEKSLHYKGRACDYRTHWNSLNGREVELRNKVKARLGDDFDVVMEDVGGSNEHLHVEYDPK